MYNTKNKPNITYGFQLMCQYWLVIVTIVPCNRRYKEEKGKRQGEQRQMGIALSAQFCKPKSNQYMGLNVL